MKSVKGVWIILIFFPVLAVAGQPASVKGPVIIDTRAFSGFEKCFISKELWSSIESVYENPKRKNENTFVYEVKAQYCGMPVKEIWVGVCNKDGSRQCGWASYFMLVIPKPLKDVKRRLKDNFGIDFTIEERDIDAGVTLRPILERSRQNKNESVLYCDPGGL